MLSHRRVRRPRSVSSFALVALGFSALVAFGTLAPACAEEAERIPSGNTIERPPRGVGSASPGVVGSAPPAEAPPATIDVGGRVVDSFETPVIGRAVTVVDTRGKRQEIVTDDGGGFWALGVVPPYDVAVAPAPAGTVITPLVYLGLSRRDPKLEVFEGGEPLPLPQSQPLHVAVMLPPCRVVKGACWVAVASASPSGAGVTASSYTKGGVAAVVTLEHAWAEMATRPGEKIDVHVLAGNAEYTQYWYARVGDIPARPGESTDLGGTAPSPVESTEPVIITGRATAMPVGWDWTLSSQLGLPGGATIALRYDLSSRSVLRLPLVPGATWNVGAWAQPPPVAERPELHRSSYAWSGALPVSTTSMTLDVAIAPEPIRPALEASLSGRSAGLAWDGATRALASLAIVDNARHRQRFRVYTTEAEVSLRRIEALGLGRLLPGEHVFDLTTTPNMTVDQLTEPDARRHRTRFDLHSPGARTYQRFTFMVTP